MTNPEDPDKGTRDVPVKGRDITVKQLNDAQLLLLGREARLASKESTDGARRLDAVGRVFDLLESVVIGQDDRDYLMDITVKGDLKLKDLMGFITAFSDEEEDQEQKPRIRRGRYATKTQ